VIVLGAHAMAHDVFISYSTQDKAAADAICHGLETNGVRCWIAPRDVRPGADWQQEILDAIAGSKAVVLVFTAHTNQSENVKKEVSAAVNAKAVVIPFMIEDVSPEGALKYHLEGVHWLDAYLPPLENHIEKLAAAIRNLSGSADAAPAPIIVSEPFGGNASTEPPHAPTPPPYGGAAYGAPPPPPPPAPGPFAGLTRNHYLVGGAVGVVVVLLAIWAQHLMTRPNGNEVNSSAVSSTSSAASDNAGAATAGADSSQPDRHVRVINDTQHTMEHFYASNINVNSWQEDILGSSVLSPGQSANINIDDGTGACEFDFKAVFADGQALVRKDVNVCNIGSYRYTE
jgi:hypothetical protein